MNELRSFERELIEEFAPGAEIKRLGRGTSKARVGLWIRDHLLDIEQDWVHHMWGSWIYFCNVARTMGTNFRKDTYPSFVQMIYCLNRLGLIEEVELPKEERYGAKGAKELFLRTFYRVNPGMEKDERWNYPEAALYPTSRVRWSDLPEEIKEKYLASRRLKSRLRYAERYGIPLEEVPKELRGRPRLGIPRIPG